MALDPSELTARGTLVSSLVAAGDHSAALVQLAEWSSWVRQELRLDRLTSAAGDHGWQASDTDTLSRIEAGQAAMAAGSVSAGLDHLRDAVRLAERRDDDPLRATSMFALGSNVVHAVAAHAAEGRRALRGALTFAQRTGNSALVAEALRELAYVENADGRVETTGRLLRTAATTAAGDAHATSSVRAIEGMFLADRGQHGRALHALDDSARLAESTGRMRQTAWSLSIASRSLLQRAELDTARDYAERSVRLATEARWTAMLPWMETLLAELDLADGRVDDAERTLRHAWSLSQVLGDQCWQGMAARGLGLVGFARGNLAEALHWLDMAERCAREANDRYAWIHAWVQEAVCRVTVAAHLPRAAADVTRLASIAARSHQPEFLVRAELHRAALGEGSALDRARGLAAARIDNPALLATCS